jgi:hypothetical protein
MAFRCHPDKVCGSGKRFRDIKWARDILIGQQANQDATEAKRKQKGAKRQQTEPKRKQKKTQSEAAREGGGCETRGVKTLEHHLPCEA